MPSVSEKQARVMRARAHGARFDNPKLNRIPMSVAKEYVEADKKASRVKHSEAVLRRAREYREKKGREKKGQENPTAFAMTVRG